MDFEKILFALVCLFLSAVYDSRCYSDDVKHDFDGYLGFSSVWLGRLAAGWNLRKGFWNSVLCRFVCSCCVIILINYTAVLNIHGQ